MYVCNSYAIYIQILISLAFFHQCFLFYVVDFLVYKLEAQETLNKGRVSHHSRCTFLEVDAI